MVDQLGRVTTVSSKGFGNEEQWCRLLDSSVIVLLYKSTLLKMGSYSSTTMCQYWDNC